MRVGLGQMQLKLGDSEFNIKQIQEILDDARKNCIDILVFPELANSGYGFRSVDDAVRFSEEIPIGPFSKQLLEWSKEGGLVVAGINEHTEEGLYNSAAIFKHGEHIATYRKYHLYGPEKRWFLRGPPEPLIFEYQNIICSVIICVEWKYPERIKRAAEKGAKIILHPINSGGRNHDSMCNLASRNGVYIASANRVGKELDFKFTGRSAIFNPNGEVILEMDSHSHMLGYVELSI